MLFDIRHVTQYAYDAHVRESVMELWMRPRATHLQRLLTFELDVAPAAQIYSYADGWGNIVQHFDVPHPHDRLTITARATVESTPPPPPATLDMTAWDILRGEGVRGECWDFLHLDGFAVRTAALNAFCKSKNIDHLTTSDPLSAVQSLSALLYRSFDYEAGVTTADSPIDQALSVERGVCQDFSHIMIAICRSWGVPARYVSGYLYTDEESGDRSDPAATHAWVEVFLPSLRWIGLDPTNNIPAGERHISVAIGRDYADVPPSRGVFKGDAESQLSVGVSVRQSLSATGQPEFLNLGAPAIAAARRRADTAAVRDQHHQQQQ